MPRLKVINCGPKCGCGGSYVSRRRPVMKRYFVQVWTQVANELEEGRGGKCLVYFVYLLINWFNFVVGRLLIYVDFCCFVPVVAVSKVICCLQRFGIYCFRNSLSQIVKLKKKKRNSHVNDIDCPVLGSNYCFVNQSLAKKCMGCLLVSSHTSAWTVKSTPGFPPES